MLEILETGVLQRRETAQTCWSMLGKNSCLPPVIGLENVGRDAWFIG